MISAQSNKKTLVLGASTNPQRYAYQAVLKLKKYNHDVVAFGKNPGTIDGIEIKQEFPLESEGIDTVTIYLGEDKQEDYYQSILDLRPKRVIFNPGTENPIFYALLDKEGIAYEEACTLVKLSVGNY